MREVKDDTQAVANSQELHYYTTTSV